MGQKAGDQILPGRIEGDGLLLRRWVVGDADALADAVAQNADHLRPWMAFMEHEPLGAVERRLMLDEREREYLGAGDVMLGVFLDAEIAGSCGLHRRGPPDTLEIGYWISHSLTRRGIASKVAALLTDAAFTVPAIKYVEIHHDKANRASSGIPRRLGFDLLREEARAPRAPGEVGIDCTWRMGLEDWIARKAANRDLP